MDKSLIVHADGSATLSKDRLALCLDATYELEALAYVLPSVTTNGDLEATASGLVVRGLAARFVALANVLMAAVGDDAASTGGLASTVFVAPLEGQS